jgi:predicted Ser/Thr protein kinase
MPLAPGSKVGPYEILTLLGAGGMGEVYRARDPRMGREVAIKLSAERFSDRFEREVRAVAALNHANICQIYDVGPNYLVMELIEGQSLAERIKAGAIAIEEWLAIGKQIAAGIEAAHEKGVIHRDLKPANILITANGVVKVLDFGLAVIDGPEPSASDPNNSPTMTLALTRAGVILGTAAYMSPEQARGKQADRRSDVWAFGVVLYEMVTGKLLFQGQTVSDMIVEVLSKEPELGALPPQVRYVVERCLRKDPRKRWQAIGDVRIALEEGVPGCEAAPAAPARSPQLPWAVVAACVLVTIGASLFAWRSAKSGSGAGDPVLMRLDADLGPDARTGAAYAASLGAISPDGKKIVYPIRGPNGKGMLAMRVLDKPTVTPIVGTEDGSGAFFSPDSQWIGFFADGKLKKIALSGGTAVTLAEASNPRGGTWAEDGTIVAALTNIAGLQRLSASRGSQPQPLTALRPGESTHRWPQFLPGGDAVLFTSSRNISDYESAELEVISLKTRERKSIHSGGYFGRYTPTGHILYVHDGTLFAAAMDLGELKFRGEPVPMLTDLAASSTSAAGQFDFSRGGTLVYKSGKAEPETWSIAELGADGTRKAYPRFAKPAAFFDPRLSPDGRLLALGMEDKGLNLYVYELRSDTLSRLTFAEQAINSVWMPDSRHIAFQAVLGEQQGIAWTRSDGAGGVRRLLEIKGVIEPHSVTPDSRALAYQVRTKDHFEIWTLPLDVSDPDHPKPGTPQPFAQGAANFVNPTLSSDGHWMAYASDETGIYEIYVRPFPATQGDGKWQVTSGGGKTPAWTHDGKSLFFESIDGRIMATACTVNGASFASGKPRRQFDVELTGSADYRHFDVSPDGKRFVALLPGLAETQGSLHLTFLLNFFDDLRRKVPAGN